MPMNEQEHAWRDFCWSCAPYWWIVPVCPNHKVKLALSGYCKLCKKFYDCSGAKEAMKKN